MAHTEECRGCSSENRCDFIRCTKEIEKEIRAKAIDEVFDFLKTQRDKKCMKVNFDDLEIRKYKEQLKGGEE